MLLSRARRSAPLATILASFLIVLPVSANPNKEQTYGQLVDLAAQIQALKTEAARSPAGANQYESLLTEYRKLSEQLGGDDPGNLVIGNGVSTLTTRIAPGAPPDPPGGPGACTVTTTNYASSPGTTITDGAPIAATIPVVNPDSYLWDVDLNTDISHTFAADLDITLTSPAATTVTITTDSGGGNDDIFAGTLWDDDALVPVTDFPHANLTLSSPLQPEGAFGAFVGPDPNGTWTLDIADDAGGDDGTLNSWSLDITTLDHAPTFVGPTPFMDSPGTTITDGAPVAATIVVAGLDPFLCDVNVVTDISHTFASDLDITLDSPGGTSIAITTDNGGGNDDVFAGTTWDDSAATPVTDNVYTDLVTATPLQPEGALGAFIGEDPNGTWTLSITDDAGGDDGTLNAWTLEFVTCACEVPVELMSFDIE